MTRSNVLARQGDDTFSLEFAREIFDNMRDFICLHTVVQDREGNLTDCILQRWNAAYSSVRKNPPEAGQSMVANYFTPAISVKYANEAWQNGSSTQLFEMTETMSDTYSTREEVIRFGVRWQRIGQLMLEVGTDLATFDRLLAHQNLGSALTAQMSDDVEFCRTMQRLGDIDRAILDRLAEGDTDARIAESVFINLQTVRNHVSKMLKLFDCENRTQLALLVVKHHQQKMHGA